MSETQHENDPQPEVADATENDDLTGVDGGEVGAEEGGPE